jgi:hypothetical protein
VAVPNADTIASEAASFGFELDRLDLDGKQRLELRGRWFGVRGRRFMRPTLTMRIDGVKHRLLADLEHKPWVAKDGEEWVVSFSPAPHAGEADEIELAVAPDIAISIPPPGSKVALPTIPLPRSSVPPASAKRSANGAGAEGRTAPRRKPKADPARRAREEERAKTRDLARELEGAKAGNARLAAERDAERDVLTTELRGVRGEKASFVERVSELERQLARSDASANARLAEARKMVAEERAKTRDLARELESAKAGYARLVAERDALSTELKGIQGEQARFTDRVSELERKLAGSDASANARLVEARKMVAAERAEGNRLRKELDQRKPVIAERDQLARQLEAALAERDRLAAEASQLRAARPETPPAPRGGAYLRPASRSASRRRESVWTVRASALIALCVVLLALVFMLHSA